MILYDPNAHEALLVAWHFHLKEDPDEHAGLFMEPLRNLTGLLGWAANQVKMMIVYDARGLWAAAWIEPCLSGAFYGVWLRKDYRDIRGLVFVRKSLIKALDHFPTVISITKQKRLYEILLRLGCEYRGEFPHLFEGDTAYIYVLTKESREAARHERGDRRRYQEREIPADSTDEGFVRVDRHEGLALDSGVLMARSEAPQSDVRRGAYGNTANAEAHPNASAYIGSNGSVARDRPQKRRRSRQSQREHQASDQHPELP